jgi:hypothetical protein
MPGFGDLTTSDQRMVQTALRKGHVEDAEWNGVSFLYSTCSISTIPANLTVE